jgi:drug/metabolite transporter (DMT)-like permease
VLRGGERPKPVFWGFSAAGAAVVATFALSLGGGHFSRGDGLMVAAILVCGLGYAEGAVLARRLGGWQVISWALIVALPAMAVLGLHRWPAHWGAVGLESWAGLAYVSVFSMLVGFVFWYRGLAIGGIARVGQLQLLQPFFGLGLAAAILHEAIAWTMIATALAVLACVGGARRFA